VIWSGEADTDPAMRGKATLAMVESSTVMIVANMTETVTMPRLIVGSEAVAALVNVSTHAAPRGL
jgi:hypothetical protein